ncbi:MAG: Slp family lipoprotein [Pseudomonadota bacterium]
MRLCRLFLLLMCVASAAAAAPPAPGLTREQTLDQDFLGPRIEWMGEIVGTLHDNDDTCFILVRLESGFELDVPTNRFIACQPGFFQLGLFAPGRVLEVTGNLGAATPRSIGGQTLDYPLVAGAIIRPTEWQRPFFPPGYRPDPYFYPYPPYPYPPPYYDPYWRPWRHQPWRY